MHKDATVRFRTCGQNAAALTAKQSLRFGL
ncbi:hypothetical protein FHT78_001255 [Rhizobium sp. BK196]|nr:hypothetical protein [Rhizobium sp. BK196]